MRCWEPKNFRSKPKKKNIENGKIAPFLDGSKLCKRQKMRDNECYFQINLPITFCKQINMKLLKKI